jgi:hypothetical protein
LRLAQQVGLEILPARQHLGHLAAHERHQAAAPGLAVVQHTQKEEPLHGAQRLIGQRKEQDQEEIAGLKRADRM